MEKRPEISDMRVTFWVAMRPVKWIVLPFSQDGRLLVMVESAKAHIIVKVENPLRLFKEQFGFRKIRLCGITNNITRTISLHH